MSKHWTVDECPDANGHYTIRRAEGSPNGNTGAQPIATVYTAEDAQKIAALPALAEAARLKRNVIIHDDPRFIGRWVAVPEEDFDKLRAALKVAGIEE